MKMILILLALAGAAQAEDVAPKSPAAVSAEKKFDTAATKARVAYLQAMILAEKQLVADLDAAMKVATRAANLDEADAIKSKKADVQSKLEANQGELKNPKGSEDSTVTADAPAVGGGDTLTFQGALAMLPKELRPANEGKWETQKMVKANEWLNENILGKTLRVAVLNSGGVTANDAEHAGGSFQLVENHYVQIIGEFSEKKTSDRALKMKPSQRVTIQGIVQTFRFSDSKTAYVYLKSAEVVG